MGPTIPSDEGCPTLSRISVAGADARKIKDLQACAPSGFVRATPHPFRVQVQDTSLETEKRIIYF